MGSGKSTAGRKLAGLVGRRFVDADVELEARTGRSVATWFEVEGEAGFRAAEAELLVDVLGRPDPVVLGAGGGVVVTEANRERLMGDDVAVVYLHAEPAFLASRVTAKAHRPLLAGDPAEVLGAMYDKRDGWYRAVADAVVEVRPAHDAGDRPKWRLAELVAEALTGIGVVDPAVLDTAAATRTAAGDAKWAGS
jgi:shikimate kinase